MLIWEPLTKMAEATAMIGIKNDYDCQSKGKELNITREQRRWFPLLKGQ